MQAGVSLFLIDRLRHYNHRRNSFIKFLSEKSEYQQAHESGQQVSLSYIKIACIILWIRLGSSKNLNIGASIPYSTVVNWIPLYCLIQHIDRNNINLLFHKISDAI